ncbi:endonuclease/exonuclease/phosphatase family protein [Dysgonomonas sp. Marseille-P4677]|uniref:endonuclease/exonuclease/phosphatase family protein n=1 Tax=Dysgonomonas sp. Marseille-P4677 TaxID=2364790 RepID=UPI00191298B8|nr:endonuclease/exonuclease/phosphatase family protein [Dysgonomonas sp. Marseille-P4677]MBK5720005.1 endonuclease/exonuclease/phosphatase family protein [Dysgonomonas sp. Marseille-P4677]
MINNIRYLFICVLLVLLPHSSLMAQTSFRLMNFNTRMSGELVNYSAKPFATLIKKHNPDFIILQEVDYFTVRNGGKDFTTELAAELGMFSAFGSAITYQQGKYGVAILSKYPIQKISNNPLTSNSADLKEKRTVLYIDVILPGNNEKVRVAATHLDHSTDNVRLDMVRQLDSYIGNSLPIILAGDFNAKPGENAIVQGMATWQRICNNFPTFPAIPTSKIDYIFAKPTGKWTVKSYEILKETGISDHCALVTDVEYNK